MKFYLTADPKPNSDDVDIHVVVEADNGDRTRWTCGGLSRESPVPRGLCVPLGYDVAESHREPLLPLTREEALQLADAIYAATHTTPTETGDTWGANEGAILEFLSGFEEIALRRPPR